jgi:hypothetical protein
VDGKTAKGIPTGRTVAGLPAGITWEKIRFSDTQTTFGYPSGFNVGQLNTYADHEYAPARPTLYRASITYLVGGANTVRSPYSNIVVVYAAPPPVTLIRSVTDPMLQAAVNRRFISTTWGRKSQDFQIDEDAQIFHPLGSDAAPVKVRDWVGGENGDLSLFTISEAQAARLAALVQTASVIQIQWAQGGRTYALVTGRSYTEELHYSSICDIDGQTILPYMRFDQWTLTYIETVAP